MLEAVSTVEEKYDDNMQEDYDISELYNRKRHSIGRRFFDQEISVADEWFSSRIAWMDSAVQTLDVMDAMDVMLIEVAQVAQSNVYWVSLLGVDDSNQTVLQVYDATGRMLYCYDLGKREGQNSQANAEINLSPGFYILRAINGSRSATRKVLHTEGWW